MQYSRNEHHQHARWRMTFTILCLLGIFANLVEAAPTGSEPKTPTLERLMDSPKDSFNERVGSPIELAWQAWLILSKSEKGPFLSEDPATLVRRITPKSIFIAPELNSGCSGQNYDENRCKYIKTINVNTSLQRKFLLDRLNAKHDRQKQQEEQEQSKIYDVAGPFQLNIPFNDKGATSNDDTSKVPETPKIQITKPLEIKIPGVIAVSANEEKKEQVEHDDTATKTQAPEESLPEHVPVIDIVHEETNESFADSVVDYKIPSAAKQVGDKEKELENDDTLLEEEGDISDDEDDEEDKKQLISTTTAATTTTPKYVQPTVIVLFSAPTKAPASSETLEEVVKRMENTTGNWTKDFLSSIIPISKDEQESMTVHFPRNATQDIFIINATQNADDVYTDEETSIPDEDIDDHEDYSTDDSITESTDDDFAETTEDELLKPGEAGMTIPIITNQQFDNTDWHKTDSTEKITSIETPASVSTVKPLNASSIIKEVDIPTTMKPEDADVNVSSEVSINGDFILETTLVNVNTDKVKNTTEAAITNADFVTIKDDINGEKSEKFQLEKELLPKPDLVFSTPLKEQHPQSSSSQIKPVIIWGVDEETAKRQNNDPLKVNLGLLPVQKDDTIDEQASYSSEKIVLPDLGQKFQPIPPPNFKQQGFVRFPSHDDRPHSSSFVRFPSDEVNSIHNLDFKPRLPHSREEFVSTTSTKSSVPFYQKQSHWHRGSRTDRQHSGFKQHWSESNRQSKAKQQLNIQDFWAKLTPVVPDLVHLPTTSHGSHNEPYGGDAPRRSRFKTA